MRHAKVSDLKEIYRHFQKRKDVSPHVRLDALKRRVEAHQCIYQGGVVITYQRYKKRTCVGDINIWGKIRDAIPMTQVIWSRTNPC